MTKAAGLLDKQLAYHGVPWEEAFGYTQAVRVGQTIHVSGQLSHDETGQLVGAAPLDATGRILDASNMELQMRTSYANAVKLLAEFGATLDHVVEETIFVTDMDAAFAVAGAVRKAAYGTDRPACASTIVETPRLALRGQLVEVGFTVILPAGAPGRPAS
ncbi:RidA family protein [Geminicoccus flavidas]|uniref:RidA family protein n=1 Tax=Geminicoccus flavidas TaxID=2506407 RepID=UPI001356B5BE|nr:RidA family protein [Geminicoccus flavidas]